MSATVMLDVGMACPPIGANSFPPIRPWLHAHAESIHRNLVLVNVWIVAEQDIHVCVNASGSRA